MNHYKTTVLILLACSFGCQESGSREGQEAYLSDTENTDPATMDSDGDSTTHTSDIEADADSHVEGSQPCENVVLAKMDPTCEYPPVIFVHGFLASGDSFANHANLFKLNGYPAERLHVFDWNTFDEETDHVGNLLSLVNKATEDSGCAYTHLMGHSAGGGLSVSFLEEEERAKKVAKYVHIGSFPLDELPGANGQTPPSLFIWSEGDLAVPVEGASAIPMCMLDGELEEQDHYAVATSTESFEEIYTFLMEKPPENVDFPEATEKLTVGGRVVTLGENVPLEAELIVSKYDPAQGTIGEELWSGVTEADGNWANVEVEPGQAFAIRATSADKLTVTYYREGQSADNALVYVRMLGSSADSISGILSALLNISDESAVLVVFCVNRALISGKDSLTIDGVEMLDSDFAPPEKTGIAFFFQDSNGDKEAGPIDALLSNFPFLNGRDVYLPAGETTTVIFNGRKFVLPNLPSDTDGVSILVVE